MAMMHTDLVGYYERIFAFRQYHNWGLEELEGLIPWEFDVMTSLLSNFIEQQEMLKKQAQTARNSR